MTTNSYTGIINTKGDYKSISEITGFSFTTDNKYTLCSWDDAYIKIADAEFPIVAKEKLSYKATSDTIYIKTNGFDAIFTILEN